MTPNANLNAEEQLCLALGQLPELSSKRLNSLRRIYDNWLELQHMLSGLDRYHLHDAPKALENPLPGQVMIALGKIEETKALIGRLSQGHETFAASKQEEESLKKTLARLAKDVSGDKK